MTQSLTSHFRVSFQSIPRCHFWVTFESLHSPKNRLRNTRANRTQQIIWMPARGFAQSSVCVCVSWEWGWFLRMGVVFMDPPSVWNARLPLGLTHGVRCLDWNTRALLFFFFKTKIVHWASLSVLTQGVELICSRLFQGWYLESHCVNRQFWTPTPTPKFTKAIFCAFSWGKLSYGFRVSCFVRRSPCHSWGEWWTSVSDSYHRLRGRKIALTIFRSHANRSHELTWRQIPSKSPRIHKDSTIGGRLMVRA